VRRRAVIFDDNDLIRRNLWYFFDQRGYEVFTFPEPGLCPLHVVRECPCPVDASCADLIISDVDMLGTNGIDYIESLIAKGCKQRNFALMSGNFASADIARAVKLGCVLFSKPLDMHAIAAWVEAVEQSIPSARILYNWVAADQI
jgi:DNA-binding response OmpR family regulator